MGRLIEEIEIYKRLRPKVDNGTLDEIMLDMPTVEAISKVNVYKAIQETMKYEHKGFINISLTRLDEILKKYGVCDDENKLDDNVRWQLLDKLSKESIMVLETAYVYAKNYVLYGIDITKAWTTAVQQASNVERVKLDAWAKAYDSFKKDYENRFKEDMVAMLRFLWNDIEDLDAPICDYASSDCISKWQVNEIIKQKINALKSESEERK